jgi:3-hydroxyisobutyrate dehydrogenase
VTSERNVRQAVAAREAAVVGLGNLGMAIGAGLASSGWAVRGYDVSSGRREAAAERGVEPVQVESIADAPVILLVVPDEVPIRALLRDEGLADRLTEDHLVVCHSTVLPDRARELADEVEATGAGFLEVPVSGGPERAERGELTLFVSGRPEVVEAARPLLETEGADLVVIGDVGAASAAKLANQLVMFSAQAALFEALRLADSYGVDEAAVLKALETATGDTWVGRNWGFFDRVAADYDEAGVPASSRPWVKDTAEIIQAGADRNLSMPLAGLIQGSIGPAIEEHAARANELVSR